MDGVEHPHLGFVAVMKLASLPSRLSMPVAVVPEPDGSSPHGSDNTSLSAVQRGVIGKRVRDCWTRDAGSLHADTFQVHLIVTTDATGVARQAEIAPGDPAAPEGSPLHLMGQRAVRAVLGPRCSSLPLPEGMLGAPHRFDFTFKP